MKRLLLTAILLLLTAVGALAVTITALPDGDLVASGTSDITYTFGKTRPDWYLVTVYPLSADVDLDVGATATPCPSGVVTVTKIFANEFVIDRTTATAYYYKVETP